jgi:hypothetical protein
MQIESAVPVPWLTVQQAAKRQIGLKLIYREAEAGRLNVAAVGDPRKAEQCSTQA